VIYQIVEKGPAAIKNNQIYKMTHQLSASNKDQKKWSKKEKADICPQGYAGCEQPTRPLRDQISDESRVAENNKIVFIETGAEIAQISP